MAYKAYGGIIEECNKRLSNRLGKRKFMKAVICGHKVNFIKGVGTLTVNRIDGLPVTVQGFYEIKGLLEAVYSDNNQWATFNTKK